MGVVLRRRLEDVDVRARDLSVAVGHTRERIAYGHEVLAQLVQARTYKRDKDGKFSSGGGPGTGRDITGDDAAMQDIYDSTTDENGQWKSDEGGDAALAEVARLQGFDGKPTVLSEAEFNAEMASGGHTVLYRGVKAELDRLGDPVPGGKSAAEVHDEIREGRYRPGNGFFGNGYYMAPGMDKARSFSDGSEGSLGTYALHRDARKITYTELRDRFDKVFTSPQWEQMPLAKKAIITDWGRFAATLGFDAIHVPVGTPMVGGGSVQREEYVVLNRGALLAKGPQ